MQQKPLPLDVPVLAQSTSTSCGEAAIVMAYNYAYPADLVSEQEVVEYASAHGYYTSGAPPFTSPAGMVQIASHYAEDFSTGAVDHSGQGLALLIQKLRQGEPIIIDVLSDLGDPKSEAHFVVVTGISVSPRDGRGILVQYNDPLSGTTEVAEWAGSAGLWHAWRTNADPGGSGWWLAISPP